MIRPMYAVAIREAVASKDVNKMKAIANDAKKVIKDQKDLDAALIDLLDAIEHLEKKH